MRRWVAWVAALFPALMGLGLALLFQSNEAANLILAFEVDLGTVLLLAGLFSTLIALSFVAMATVAQRRLRRTVDDERSQAAEAHRRFIRRLDHELKNPLTAMRIGLADLGSAGLKADQQRMVAGVGTQAERLGRLAADLRKLAELETRPLERSTIAVGPMLEEILELIQGLPVASDRRVALSVPRAPWPLPPCTRRPGLNLPGGLQSGGQCTQIHPSRRYC
jgi:two-component system, OmpR family, sensor kinase